MPHSLSFLPLHSRRLLATLSCVAAVFSSLQLFAVEEKAASGQRPVNVLYIVVDDLRTSLGCYGDATAKTPAIDRLAASGVQFDRAYVNYPICGPSRASFLSGLRPQTSGYFGWAVPPKATLLPAWFKQHGYFTAEFGKVFHTDRLAFDDEIAAAEKKSGKPYAQPVFRTLNPPGCWDISDICSTADDPCGYGYSYGVALRAEDPKAKAHVLARGSLRPEGLKGGFYWEEWVETDLPDEQTSDGIVVRRAAQAMEQAVREGRPFLVAAGIRRPHQVLAAPQRYFDRFPLADVPLPPPEPAGHLDKLPALALGYGKQFSNRIYTSEERRQLWRAYHANVAFVDAQVELLLATLDRLGLRENTVVVFHTDNGLHLGEHGGLSNKDTLFEEATRTPLIIAGPDLRSAGRHCGRPVELVDVFPTLTDLCGLPRPGGLHGLSLRPLLADADGPAIRPGAISVVRRTVAGRVGSGFSGLRLNLEHDAGPSHQILGLSIRTERWRYTEWDGANFGAELYDETEDPRELNNLAGDPRFASVQTELKQLLTR
jgi:iduronate 2-sulfatase